MKFSNKKEFFKIRKIKSENCRFVFGLLHVIDNSYDAV